MATYPSYESKNKDKKKKLEEELANRPAFSYDPASDAAYLAYKDQYTRLGKEAMKDTQGQAAALTGGYGSSYAETAGFRAFENYLQKLNDLLPDLEKRAYDRYKDEGENLQAQYARLTAEEDREYQKYLDSYGQWKDEQERSRIAEQTAYDREQDEKNRQERAEQRDYDRRTAEEQTAYDREQDKLKLENDQISRKEKAYSSLYKLIADYGYNPTDEELTAAGMSRAQANALLNAYTAGHTVASSGGSGSGSGTSKAASVLKPLIGLKRKS